MLAPGLPIQGPTSLRAWGCCPRSHLLSRLPRPGSKPPPQALSCAFLLRWSLSLGAQHQGLGHLTPVPTEPLTWRQLPFPTVGQTSGQEGRMWPQVAPARESQAGQVLAETTMPGSEQVHREQGQAAWVLPIALMGDLVWPMRKTAGWASKGGACRSPGDPAGLRAPIRLRGGCGWAGLQHGQH